MPVSENMIQSVSIQLMCSDGKTFDLDEATALMSYTLSTIVNRARRYHMFRRFTVDMSEDPQLRGIPSEIVEKVIRYCERHAHPDTQDDLNAFDADLTNVDQIELAKLGTAARRLEVQSLFELAVGVLTRDAKTYEEYLPLARILQSVRF